MVTWYQSHVGDPCSSDLFAHPTGISASHVWTWRIEQLRWKMRRNRSKERNESGKSTPHLLFSFALATNRVILLFIWFSPAKTTWVGREPWLYHFTRGEIFDWSIERFLNPRNLMLYKIRTLLILLLCHGCYKAWILKLQPPYPCTTLLQICGDILNVAFVWRMDHKSNKSMLNHKLQANKYNDPGCILNELMGFMITWRGWN